MPTMKHVARARQSTVSLFGYCLRRPTLISCFGTNWFIFWANWYMSLSRLSKQMPQVTKRQTKEDMTCISNHLMLSKMFSQTLITLYDLNLRFISTSWRKQIELNGTPLTPRKRPYLEHEAPSVVARKPSTANLNSPCHLLAGNPRSPVHKNPKFNDVAEFELTMHIEEIW